MKPFIYILILLLGVLCVDSATIPGPIVTTPNGKVQGVTNHLNSQSNVTIDIFRGLPYAQPPVGALRLKKPEPPLPWTGVKDAKADKTTCIQRSHGSDESEDCLYLDVFRPKIDNASLPLPVMVYIHGGGFRSGSKNGGGGQYLASNGVIVVSINYRLGPLGYLSTDDASMPGNYGALDQIAALKWVQSNIGAFGGDPSSVTIFGESAGSASVSLLIFSPLAKGLFHRAIMMSGVATTSRDVEPPNTQVTLKDVTLIAGKALGCTQNPGPDFLACLQQQDALALYNTSLVAGNQDHSSGTFRPRVEATFGFMPDYPLRLLSRGEFNHVSTIRGFNSQEQGGAVQDKEDDGLTRDEFRNKARGRLGMYPYLDDDVYVNLLEDVYLENTTDPFAIRAEAVNMLSDYTYILPTIRETKLSRRHRAGAKTYLYNFSYKSSFNNKPDWQAVTHGKNVGFVFGLDPTKSRFNQADLTVSEMMQTMWTNFAKFDDPTPSGKINQPLIHWDQLTNSRPTYLLIDEHLQLKTYDTDKEEKKLSLFERTVQEYLQSIVDRADIIG